MTESEELTRRVAALEAQVAQLNKDLLESQLDEWKARIDALEVQLHLGQMEAREELNPLIEQLRNRWLDARQQFDRAGSAAEEALAALREGIRKAVADLRAALDDAAARLGR
jgi:predicted  nucleic acid-binding Zn-ribbon protein